MYFSPDHLFPLYSQQSLENKSRENMENITLFDEIIRIEFLMKRK